MTTNFEELLGQQVESVEPPRLFPIGSYDAVLGRYETGNSSNKGTPFVRFPVKLVGPKEDVDQDEFEAAGGMEKLINRSPLRLDFYMTPDASFRLRQFLENTLEMDSHNRTFDSMLPETDGMSLVVQIKHEAGQNEGEMFMRIGGTAAAS
jgi:hypothetical protein